MVTATDTVQDAPAGWQDLLAEQCRRKSKAEVGREIGYSRTAVSLALTDRYPGNTDQLAQAVIATYGNAAVQCPHLDAVLSLAACQSHHSRPMPLGHAADMRHWRACQRCPNNPNSNRNEGGGNVDR